MNICNVCGRELKQQHDRFCIYKKEDIDKIRELYTSGLTPKDLLNFGYSKSIINFSLKHRRRSLKESVKLVHKNHPEVFKFSDETKIKISNSQKKYYSEHPDKLPWVEGN